MKHVMMLLISESLDLNVIFENSSSGSVIPEEKYSPSWLITFSLTGVNFVDFKIIMTVMVFLPWIMFFFCIVTNVSSFSCFPLSMGQHRPVNLSICKAFSLQIFCQN